MNIIDLFSFHVHKIHSDVVLKGKCYTEVDLTICCIGVCLGCKQDRASLCISVYVSCVSYILTCPVGDIPIHFSGTFLEYLAVK